MHTLGISHGKKGKQRQRHKFCRVFSLWICHCRGEADMEIKMFTIFQFYFLATLENANIEVLHLRS